MRTFEQRISEEVLKVTSKVVIIFLITLTIILTSAVVSAELFVKSENGKNMKNFIMELHENNDNIVNHISSTINSNDQFSIDDTLEKFNTLEYQSLYSSSLIVLNNEGDIILSTFPLYQISDHMKLFIKFSAPTIGYDLIFRSYNYSKDISLLVSGARASENYVVLLIQNKEQINQQMIKNEISGVLVDKYDRIVSSSNIAFETSQDKKFYFENGIFNDDKYERKFIKLNEIDLYGYSMYKTNDNFIILLIIMAALVIFYFFVFYFLKKAINKIAAKQLKSFNNLLSEIEIATNENIKHRLTTSSNDEFEIIAHEINSMNESIMLLTKNNTELTFRNQISELKHLEAQFNPHFLYNTLDTIRLTSKIDSSVTEDIILRLTKILRYSIDNTENTVLIKTDIEYTKMYCELQKIRFGKNFSYEINIDADCTDIEVPKLLLQPLIENSIKNSFNHKTTANVEVKIYKKNNYLVLEVCDDGDGIEEDKLIFLVESLYDDMQIDNHHGLFNTYRRIKLIYGKKCTIHIESKINQGTKISIIIDLDGKVDVHV